MFNLLQIKIWALRSAHVDYINIVCRQKAIYNPIRNDGMHMHYACHKIDHEMILMRAVVRPLCHIWTSCISKKWKVNFAKRIVNEYPDVFRTHESILFCKFGEVVSTGNETSNVKQHIETDKQKKAIEMKKNSAI